MAKIIAPYIAKCLMCGKDFLNEWGEHQKYCGSQKDKTGCSYVAKVNKFRRFRANHRDRISVTMRRINQRERLKILQKYNFICQMCRLKNKMNGFMDIDHKDGNRENSKEDNLWILCPNCHRIKTINQRSNNTNKNGSL